MPTESQIPIGFASSGPPICRRGGDFLRYAVRIAGDAAAVLHGLAAVDRHRCRLDRHHHRGAGGDALHHPALCHCACRAAPGVARRPGAHGPGDRARLCRGRRSARAVAGFSGLCCDLRGVDADGAAHGRLCAARCHALRPRLRTAAALGIGRLRGRGVGLRVARGRHHCREADLGHRRGGCALRRREPRAAEAGRANDRQGRLHGRIVRCCATPAFSPSSWRLR